MSRHIQKLFHPFAALDFTDKSTDPSGFHHVVARERIRYHLGNRSDIIEAWRKTLVEHYGSKWKKIMEPYYGMSWVTDLQNMHLRDEFTRIMFNIVVVANGDSHMIDGYGEHWVSQFIREFDQDSH